MRKSILIAACASLALASCGKNSGNVEIKTQGAKITTAGTGKSVALPDNFPKDVPIISGGSVQLATVMENKTTLMLTASAPAAEAVKFYQDGLKAQGWKVGATMAAGAMNLISAEKENRTCGVQVASANEGSTISITVGMKGK